MSRRLFRVRNIQAKLMSSPFLSRHDGQRRATEHSAELFAADRYNDYLLFHGLSVESAEALAEMWHKRIREESSELRAIARPKIRPNFSIKAIKARATRSAIPPARSSKRRTELFELLKPERIEVELSEEFQLHPEQSTSAIIVHHPQAKYLMLDQMSDNFDYVKNIGALTLEQKRKFHVLLEHDLTVSVQDDLFE